MWSVKFMEGVTKDCAEKCPEDGEDDKGIGTIKYIPHHEIYHALNFTELGNQYTCIFFNGKPCLQDITLLLCNWFLLSKTSSAVILSLREIGPKLLLPPLSQLHFIKPPLLLQVLGITFFSGFLCWKHCDFSILDGIFNFCFEGDPLQLARKLHKDPPSHLLYRRMKFDKE